MTEEGATGLAEPMESERFLRQLVLDDKEKPGYRRIKLMNWKWTEQMRLLMNDLMQKKRARQLMVEATDSTGVDWKPIRDEVANFYKESSRYADGNFEFAAGCLLEEMIVNAVKYNRGPVSVTYGISGKMRDVLCTRIVTPGDGWRPQDMPNPTHPRFIQENHGRGHIMTNMHLNAAHTNGWMGYGAMEGGMDNMQTFKTNNLVVELPLRNPEDQTERTNEFVEKFRAYVASIESNKIENPQDKD